MWHPLVLMLLLFPAVSIPSATAAPIPDARSQDSLQIVLQGCNCFLGVWGVEGEKKGGADSKRSQRNRGRGREMREGV